MNSSVISFRDPDSLTFNPKTRLPAGTDLHYMSRRVQIEEWTPLCASKSVIFCFLNSNIICVHPNTSSNCTQDSIKTCNKSKCRLHGMWIIFRSFQSSHYSVMHFVHASARVLMHSLIYPSIRPSFHFTFTHQA